MQSIPNQFTVFIFIIIMGFFSPALDAQRLYEDPIPGPSVRIIYINNLNQKSNVECGETILTSDMLNTAEDGELPEYLVRLTNFGGIDIPVQEEDIQMRGDEFSIATPFWRLFPDGMLKRGDEVTFKIRQNSNCFNFGSGILELSIRGLSESPCRINFEETIPTGNFGNALLTIRESFDNNVVDPDDGVYDIEPISFNTDFNTKFITIFNTGDGDAIINGLSSEGHAEVLENITFPLLIPAGSFYDFRVRNELFSCGTRRGKFIFDTEAEFSQCGFGGADGVIPYRQASYLDCPGSDYALSVDGIPISCGTTISFDGDFIPGADVRTFTVTNTGSSLLSVSIDPRVYNQRFFRIEYFLDSGCGTRLFVPCVRVLAPGESHSFTVTRSENCAGDCDAYIRFQLSTSPYTCKINLSDSPAGIITPDYPQPGGKSLTDNRSEAFRVFPTLTSNSAMVVFGEELQAPAVLQIIDQLGRQVKRFALQPFTPQVKLPVSDLAPGMYYVRIEGSTETQRIIKQ